MSAWAAIGWMGWEMQRIEISLNGPSLRRTYALWLSLVLVFGWVSVGGSSTTASDGSLSQLCLRASAGVAFLAFSLPPASSLLRGKTATLVACTACAVVGVVLRTMSAAWGVDALLMGAGVAVGVGFALFVRLWFGGYGGHGTDLLAVLLLASGLGGLLCGVFAVGRDATTVLSAVMPLAGVIVYALGVPTDPAREKAPRPRDESGSLVERRSFWIQSAGLLLCNFASGIVSYSGQVVGMPSVGVTATVALVLASVLLLAGFPRREVLFSGLVIAVCFCIVLSFVLPQTVGWPLGFARIGFWLIMYYSMAWFFENAQPKGGLMAPVCLRGFAMIYLSSAVADAVGRMLGTQMACIVTLGLLVAALVIIFLDASTARVSGDAPKPPTVGHAEQSSITEDRVAQLANTHGLTDTECEILGYLARGYSLRRAAEQVRLSESAAKYHRRNSYQKLGITSREELIDLVEGNSVQSTR